MNKLTLLEEKQIFGDKALDVIKKRGTRAAITDFAILLGGDVSNNYYVKNGNNPLTRRTGYYWTKTKDNDNDAYTVDYDGTISHEFIDLRIGGIRPVLLSSNIKSIISNGVSERAKDGILKVEYGYYPKSAVSKEMQQLLEGILSFGQLIKTGNIYTTDSRRYDKYEKVFEPQSHVEYHYNGKKYVKVRANSYDDTFTLSNGETYKRGSIVWVEVEPVKWLVDEKSKLMITEELIVSGVQFNHESDYKGNFSNTDLKYFMDKYLSKELFQNSNTINIDDKTNILSDKIIKELYSKGYTKEQITTIAFDILNQMLENTTNKELDVKQKLKTPNK